MKSRNLALTALILFAIGLCSTATTALAQAQMLRETAPAQSEPETQSFRNAAAPSPVAASPATRSLVEQMIFQGSEFEADGKWGDALTHYEQAIKDYPQDKKLQSRLLNARIHYDLQRRYQDPSYLKSVHRGDQRTALETLAEVLLKIQSHHVDQPDWLAYARRGLSNIDVALFDPAFQKQHLRTASYDQLHQAQLVLHQKLNGRTIGSRQDLYTFAAHASQILRHQVALSETASIYEFVCGAVGTLDPYSAFLTADQFSETMSHIEGNFVGLGVEIRPARATLEIVDTIKGGPAAKGGLRAGDMILAIDGKLTTQIGGEVAADLLRGIEGSTVVMDVQAPGETVRKLSLQRRRVDIQSVEEARIIDQQAGVAYIKLVNFQKTTKRDFDQALWSLHQKGMRSLIVDLRGNPGGLLNASVDLADRFITSGVIVSTRGRNQEEDYVHRAHREGTWGVPLTVLVDGNSASASEILAGAIADHRRGTIVGQRSYGKGSVQGIFPLALSNGGVRLTVAKFYSPRGTAISHRGVTPDVVVNVARRPSTRTQTKTSEPDATLIAGLRVAREKAIPMKNLQQQNAQLQNSQRRNRQVSQVRQ